MLLVVVKNDVCIPFRVLPVVLQNNVPSLRSQTAEYMRSHRDEFLPFLVQEATGELYSEGQCEWIWAQSNLLLLSHGKTPLRAIQCCSCLNNSIKVLKCLS